MKMRNPIETGELVCFYYVEDGEEDCSDGIVETLHETSVDIKRKDGLVVNIWLQSVYKILEVNQKNSLMLVAPVV